MEIQISPEELRKNKVFLATPMYGGACAGIYCRAVCDLTAMFTQMQIPLVHYYLFNESLITRARAYASDEFMRSDCTHMLFIDSDIGFKPQDVLAMLALQTPESPYDVLGAPYPKKSLVSHIKIETEDGFKTIKNLVDTKYSGKVKTIDNKGKFCWNNVIDWHVYPNVNKKKFVKLCSFNGSRMVCTFDHEVYSIKDVMNPLIELTVSCAMAGHHIVTSLVNKKTNSLYNKEQLAVLVGTILGDGYIEKTNNIRFNHSENQLKYLQFKKDILGGGEIKNNNDAICKKGVFKNTYRFNAPGNAQTKHLRSLFYDNNKKTIKNITQYIDEMSLAFWYMDDGSLQGNKYPYISLNTQSYSMTDNMILCDFFENKWNVRPKIDAYVQRRNLLSDTSKNHHKMRFICEDSDKIFSMIAKYIPKCMEYKLPEKYRGGLKHQYDCIPLDYGASLIISADYLPEDHFHYTRGSKLYDITVEHNHNFMANGFATKNCISWEKIVQAVEKGLHKPEHGGPSNLDNFVGDFVFNPAGGQTSIQIGEPADVLEIGTGFMMIRKKTFEMFREAYPQYSYKPDHIRTEHFDGSREIFMFFQAEIDRYNPENLYEQVLKDIAAGKITGSIAAQEALDKAKGLSKNDTKRYLSEDYFFSQMIRKAGGKIWLLPWMQLSHVGSFVFGGSLAHLAQAGASATADPSALGKKPTGQI